MTNWNTASNDEVVEFLEGYEPLGKAEANAKSFVAPDEVPAHISPKEAEAIVKNAELHEDHRAEIASLQPPLTSASHETNG